MPSPTAAPETTNLLKKVREDFAFCRGTFFAVLIFGSYARGEEGPYSDIDICIVLGDDREYGTLLYDEIYPHVRMDQYDVVIFEGCSREIRSDIAASHIVVECRDCAELHKYFRPYREHCPVQRNRQEILNDLRDVVDAI